MSRRTEGVKPRTLANGRTVYDVNTQTLRKRGFTSERAAVVALDDARARAAKGQRVLDARTSRTTVAEVAQQYLAAHQTTWRAGTRRKREGDWKALAPVFGHRRVVDLRATEVQEWIDASTWAPNTLGARLTVLRAILDHAVFAELVVANVARTAKLRVKRRNGRKTAPVGDDVTKWIDALDERYQIVAWLQLGLAVRSGESRGLTLDRVADSGVVTIDRQLMYERGRGHHLDTCKDDSAGEVTADPWLLELISEHVDRYGLGPDGTIASSSTGAALGEQTWTSAMTRASERSGVKMTGHKLRHAYASWLIAAGHDPLGVSRDLRHADPTTTWRYYAKPSQEGDVARSSAVLAHVAPATARKPRARITLSTAVRAACARALRSPTASLGACRASSSGWGSFARLGGSRRLSS